MATVVREKSAATAAAATTVALTSTGTTPAEIYDKNSAGVVEVLLTFNNASSMSPYGPSSPAVSRWARASSCPPTASS